MTARVPGSAAMAAALPRNAVLLAPLCIGLVVGVLSLCLGASAEYVALQMFLFVLLCPLLFIAKYDERYTAVTFLVSFLKIFFISQIVSIVMRRAPDAGLVRPELTVAAIAVGLVAGMLGICAAALVFSALRVDRPILRLNPDPRTLGRLGYVSAIIGLPAQVIWTAFTGTLTGDQHGGIGATASGVALFALLTPLSLLAICCFAVKKLVASNGRTILSREFVAALALYVIAIAPMATKAEPLKPIVAVAVTAIVCRYRPSLGLVAGGLAVLLLVAEFLYPTITIARMRAFGDGGALPVVFLQTAVEEIEDPSKFAYVEAYTNNLDRMTGHFFYGSPHGFLDRFTPLATDRLVVASRYVEPTGWTEFAEGAASVLPQTLGFKRDPAKTQRRLEAAFLRAQDKLGRVAWENTGYVGGGFLAGGLRMVAIYLFAFAFISSLVARLTFGASGQIILWIPFLVTFMLVPADATLAGTASGYFWGWVILAAAITIAMKAGVGELGGGRAHVA